MDELRVVLCEVHHELHFKEMGNGKRRGAYYKTTIKGFFMMNFPSDSAANGIIERWCLEVKPDVWDVPH